MSGLTRRVVVEHADPVRVASAIADQLASPDLAFVLLLAGYELAPADVAAQVQRAIRAPVVGCTTSFVLASPRATAVAIGFYGGVRVGVGVATELTLGKSRDAVHAAAAQLGTTAEALDPAQHVVVTLVDGHDPNVESFCIGSAAAVPQLQVVGGGSAGGPSCERGAHMYVRGEALPDAGLVLVLETLRPFQVVRSSHLVPTDVKTVVTAASGRIVEELDGVPAVARLIELVEREGLDTATLLNYAFARFIDDTPYVRSMVHLDGPRIHFASVGRARPRHAPDAAGGPRRQHASRSRGGRRSGSGSIDTLLAFSCTGRHWEARARGIEAELAAVYAEHPTVGFQSFGEQLGMLLVNHTLTGLAIG